MPLKSLALLIPCYREQKKRNIKNRTKKVEVVNNVPPDDQKNAMKCQHCYEELWNWNGATLRNRQKETAMNQ